MQPTPIITPTLQFTGGVQVGYWRASWPLAKLTVTRDTLSISSGLTGDLTFKASDIVKIIPEGGLLTGNIRIIHRVPGYDEKVLFGTFKERIPLLEQIRRTGFLNGHEMLLPGSAAVMTDTRPPRGFPLKTSAVITIVAIWNLCFIPAIYELITKGTLSAAFGISRSLSSGFMLLTSFLLLFVEPVQVLLLKPDRSITEIRPILYFLMMICGLLLISSFLTPRLA